MHSHRGEHDFDFVGFGFSEASREGGGVINDSVELSVEEATVAVSEVFTVALERQSGAVNVGAAVMPLTHSVQQLYTH